MLNQSLFFSITREALTGLLRMVVEPGSLAQAYALTNGPSATGSRPFCGSRLLVCVVFTVGCNISEQQLLTETVPLRPEASTGLSMQGPGAEWLFQHEERKKEEEKLGAAGGGADTPPRD